MELVEEILRELKARGIEQTPMVVGGIIPSDDTPKLKAQGIAAVYTPKDADMNVIMGDMVDIVRRSNNLAPFGAV
jgi:(2R)-ethylmalonyl-CoA mutase